MKRDPLEKAKKILRKIKKIAGTEEVLFQKQLKGKEFLLGIKRLQNLDIQ